MAGPLDVPMAYVPTDPQADKRAEQIPQYYSQPGKAVMPAPPDKNAHWLDEVLHEVMVDFNDDVDWLASSFSEGTRAPFSANLNEEQKLEVFRAKLFKPDGQPNEAGRAELQAIYGLPGTAKIMAEVMDKRAKPFIKEPKDFYLPNEEDDSQPSAPPAEGPERPAPPTPGGMRY